MRGDLHIGIIGGGLVGCAAAVALSRLGFKITLFDQRAPVRAIGSLGIDIRNFALSPASQEQLDQLGVWQDLAVAVFDAMTVWEEWGVSELCFTANEIGRSELGWIVESSPLLLALWDVLETEKITRRIGPIEAIEITEDRIRIGDEDVDFIIGADGADSLVRRSLNVRVVESPTQQSALATVVRTEREHGDTAWQCFLRDGPLAMLPSPDRNVCSVVWSQSPVAAERRQALNEDAFCREIAYALDDRLGKITAVDRRIVFPLTQQRVETCAPHPKVLLVGDAMRVIHPLAGLGVNLGLEDVRELVKTADGLIDITQPGAWRQFARRRAARSAVMIQAMAALRIAYGNNSPLFGWLRNIGVDVINAQRWLKQPIMREALGLVS